MLGQAISLLVNTLGLYGAAKLMNIALSFLAALLVGLCVMVVGYFFSDHSGHIPLLGWVVICVTYIVGFKMATGESAWAVIKLTIVSLILEYVILTVILKALAAFVH